MIHTNYGLGVALVRASNDHHALDQVGLLVFFEVDVSLLEAVKRVLHNGHSTFNDQLTGVNLGLCLLDLEKTLGHF